MPHDRVGGCLLCIVYCWWQWANWHCSSSAAPSLIVHLVALVQKKATFLGQTHGCTQNAWEGVGIQEWVFKNPELLKAAGGGLRVEWTLNNEVLGGTKRETPVFLSSSFFSRFPTVAEFENCAEFFWQVINVRFCNGPGFSLRIHIRVEGAQWLRCNWHTLMVDSCLSHLLFLRKFWWV